MNVLTSFFILLLAAGLAGLPPVAEARKAADSEEHIRLRAGELPAVRLTADILYRVLASEIAAQRGGYDMASQTMLDLARDTHDPRLAKRAFQFAMAGHDLQRALEGARVWEAMAPDDPEAAATALALAASNGQTSGLAKALRTRIQKAENKDKAIAQAAAIVTKMNDKKAALKVLQEALKPSLKDSAFAHLALADVAWAAEEPSVALDHAKHALSMDGGSEAAAQRVLEYGFAVDPDRALASARAFAREHPKARKLHLMLVAKLVEQRDFDGALALIQQMRASAPEDFDLMYTEAQVDYRAGRYSQAEGLLREYISVQTQRRRSINDNASSAMADAADARLLLVQIAEKQNRLNDAIRQLGLIDDPSLVFQARIHQAVLQARLGDLSAARKTIAALRPRDPQQKAVVALTLSSIYREAGRTDQAIQVLVDADKALPDTPEIKYDLGMLYERQGRFDDFEALMRDVIDLQPDNANAYNSLGYTLADQDIRLDEARELLEQAIELEPDNAFIQDSMGWYYFRAGDLGRAREFLERAYKQMPAADVAAHLGEVLWRLDRRPEAEKIWRAGLEAEPDNETLVKTLKRFGVRF